MKKISDLGSVENEKIAITIGNFDGVHKGHRKILKYIHEQCIAADRKFVVITFVPHPMHVLNPKENFLLNSYSEKVSLLEECNVDYLLEIDFNRDLSTTAPESFLEKYISCYENVEKFYVGHDFAFGANKKGGHEFLTKFFLNKKTSLEIMNKHHESDENVSSSIIRNYLDSGSIKEANNLLGRNFYISGRVIKGEGRGRQIGVPTANLSYDDYRKIPLKGVYVTETLIAGTTWLSVTNVGNNPTFNDSDKLFIETHLLDFDNDIYGEEIRVSFLARLRNERKFSNVNELIHQIKDDILYARNYNK